MKLDEIIEKNSRRFKDCPKELYSTIKKSPE